MNHQTPASYWKVVRAASGCLFVALSLLASCWPARAVSPRLISITPTGGQRGTDVQVNFYGERLQDTAEIICYEPGVTVEKILSATNKLVKATLKIASDCALGEHHLRLRAETGLSEMGTFFVGAYPVVAEVEPNNTAAKPQRVKLNTTVSGVITDEDIDVFAVTMKKGGLLSAEVEGMRLGRGVFDPRLIILDPHGNVIVNVDDTRLARQDPFASVIAAEDGDYFIEIRDVTYGGNGNCHYRLHIGSFSRPTAVFPLGGKAGERVAFTFSSEATDASTQQIELPALPDEKFGIFATRHGLVAPSPNWIRVSSFPNVLENGPNHDRSHATASGIAPPFALNGIISTNGEEDWFTFPVTKDAPLELTVFARRLRSPLDSSVEVFDATGKSVAANDDTAGADSYVKFTPSATTNYFVRVRDGLGQGGPDFGYRIEITPAEPRVTVKIPEVARNDTQSRQFIAVPRGNRFATLINAKRANFAGELNFACDGLPDGVTMSADTMAKNVDSMPLVFEASTNAAEVGRLLELQAMGTNGGTRVAGRFTQEAELVAGPNNTTYYSTTVDKLCVAVIREAPFKIRIVQPEVPLVQAGSMRLQVIADRAPGFDEPIKLQMVWNPPGVSSQPEVVIGKGETNAFYPLNAAAGAEARTWGIAVLGHAVVDEGKVFVSSQLARLEIATPFVTGKIETAWSNPGKSARLTLNLETARPFDGKATIKLCGLPDKITTAEKEISKDDKEVVFDLDVDAKCPTSTFKNLFCAVDIPAHGQLVPHTLAAGGILRVVPPKKTAAAPVKEAKK